MNPRPICAKASMALLYCVNIFFWMNLYTFVPIFPAYSAGIVASGALVGLISGSYGFTQLVLRVPMGILSDRLGRRKPFIVWGCAFGIASLLGLLFFKSGAALLVFRAMMGVAATMYVQTSVLYAGTAERLGQRPNMGALTASSSFGQITGMLLGGLVGDTAAGASGTFLLGAGAGVAALLGALVLKDVRAGGEPITLGQIKGSLASKPLLACSALAVLSQAIIFGKSFTFSPIAAQQFNAGYFQASIITALALLPQIFLSPIIGKRLLPKFGIRLVVLAGFVVIGVSCALTGLFATMGGLCLSQVLTGIGNAAVFPSLMAYCLTGIDEARRSSAMGFFQAVYGLGMFLGPWATGAVADLFSVTTSLQFNAIIALVAAALCLALLPKKQTNLKE